MVLMDPVANALTVIRNAARIGKRQVELRPASKQLGSVLKVMQKGGYVGEFEFVDDGRSGVYRVALTGRINECSAVWPRLPVGKDAYDMFEKRFLPGQDIGLLVVSTPSGVMSQKEASKRKTGGRIVAFVY
jgi:small subunit ribosomal protein S8